MDCTASITSSPHVISNCSTLQLHSCLFNTITRHYVVIKSRSYSGFLPQYGDQLLWKNNQLPLSSSSWSLCNCWLLILHFVEWNKSQAGKGDYSGNARIFFYVIFIFCNMLGDFWHRSKAVIGILWLSGVIQPSCRLGKFRNFPCYFCILHCYVIYANDMGNVWGCTITSPALIKASPDEMNCCLCEQSLECEHLQIHMMISTTSMM